ncbi:hypothetical protein M2321_000573 [Rhodoblastus acidophilus]|nr:lytic transglycosylase domain-containing protein [Rhodoblastus acidophilus]MCW2273009.1 hypothetical protein [Rhodoblastus acidophilus]
MRVFILLVLILAAAEARAEAGLREQVCGMIEKAAAAQKLPVAFLTRLIWQESAFRSQAVSPKGAQGIAQFMPGTAAERGLADPFDPEQAIPKAAEFLSDLRARFGNLGLAAAAYNGGPNRVAAWLAGTGGLPFETRNYVELITRHAVEDWQDKKEAEKIKLPEGTCLEVAGRIVRDEPRQFAGSAMMAPWGVQIAGSFNRGAALAAYTRARKAFGALTGEPMILGRRAPGRGFARFWAVRAPAPSRAAAEALCAKIHVAGGACAVLKT